MTAFRTDSDKKMQVLITSNMIHNKTLELSDIDRNYDMYMDIVDDTTQTEKKRKRAQQKLTELKKRKCIIKKIIRENDPENPLGYESSDTK